MEKDKHGEWFGRFDEDVTELGTGLLIALRREINRELRYRRKENRPDPVTGKPPSAYRHLR